MLAYAHFLRSRASEARSVLVILAQNTLPSNKGTFHCHPSINDIFIGNCVATITLVRLFSIVTPFRWLNTYRNRMSLFETQRLKTQLCSKWSKWSKCICKLHQVCKCITCSIAVCRLQVSRMMYHTYDTIYQNALHVYRIMRHQRDTLAASA